MLTKEEANKKALKYLRKYFKSSYFTKNHLEVKRLANLIYKESKREE